LIKQTEVSGSKGRVLYGRFQRQREASAGNRQTATNAFLFCALTSFWTTIADGVGNSTKSPAPCLHGWPEDGPILVMASTNKALAATADQDAGPVIRASSKGKAGRRSHPPSSRAWERSSSRIF
jgi:hypothetical protein